MPREIEKQAEMMMDLFRGLNRFRGQWVPPEKGGPRYETLPGDPNTVAHWVTHIKGEMGLGINPLTDDGLCGWGVLDFDRHKTGDIPFDIVEVAMRVQHLGLPLLTCASKTAGSLHLYLLMKKPMPATMVTTLLRHWAVLLGEPKCEVFPKQTKLAKGAAGNWLNCEYYNAGLENRYCFHSDNKLSLDEFIDLAYQKQQSEEQIRDLIKTMADDELAEAPPCVVAFYTKGVGVGMRNEAMFTIATYHKRSGKEDWKERCAEANHDKSVFEKPIRSQEFNATIRSVDKGGYTKYRCNQPPNCDNCNKDLCVTRKFGVGPEGPQKAYDLPNWGTLTKIMSDPPRYELGINGKLIHFDSMDDLMSARKVRSLIAASCNMLIPPMKDGDWHPILADKLAVMQEEEAPGDAGPAPIVAALLDRFLMQAERYNEDGKPVVTDRKNVLRGKPVLTIDLDKEGKERHIVIFRSEDFIVYLKKNKAEEAKGAGLWMLMKKMGCGHKKFRNILSSGSPKEVWFREFEPQAMTFEPPEAPEKF